MKQRGRHRRRRRGRVLRGVLSGAALALTAAATMISASQATVADGPGALRALTSAAETGKLRLTERPAPESERLAAALGRPVGVATVLADADRTLRGASGCTARERAALPVAPAATRTYCWDGADTAGWRPGAVTTSGDADDDGLWGGKRVIVSAWSHEAPAGRDPSRGAVPGDGPARVAFVDADDPARLAYTWVLLAVPTHDGRDFRGLDSSVSGMVWYQDKLIVTAGRADRTALYVYDVDRIRRAGVDSDAVGRVAGGWSAHGCRYVLTPVAAYRLSGGAGAPRPDSVSLDRSTAPDSLAVGDWVPADGDHRTRLWRYPFSGDPARAGLLATDAAGHASAGEAYESDVTGVQSVLSHQAAWYLGRAAGGDSRSALWRQDGEGGSPLRCGTDDTHRCWSGPSASLSHSPLTGEVWSQSGRTLFAVPLTALGEARD